MSVFKNITLSYDEKLDRLRLARSSQVGAVTFHQLLARCGTAGDALDALPDLAKRGGHRRSLRLASKFTAEREWAALDKMGAKLLAWGEAGYPPRLMPLEDSPPFLTVLGRLDLLAKKTVGIVGARNASANGCRMAGRLATDLGAGGLMVVSGMARGIDAAAHAGALESGTVAVLGGGVDVIYPRQNTGLYEQLLERGTVISEMPPGTRPMARHFPQRNRIISGMARGVVVVEASLRSGSLITARLALEQGREVFAVPGAALDPRGQGTNRLLRDGAVLTETAADVFDAFELMDARPAGPVTPASHCHSGTRPSMEAPAAAPAPTTENELAPSENECIQRHVLQALGPAPCLVDEIVRSTGCPVAAVSTVLMELELAGRIERHPGNQVSLATAA